MPEGDTVHKIANALRPLLEGAPLASLWIRDRGEFASLAEIAVEEVSALGKHLLIALGPRHVLHVHLGMHGKWFRSRRGDANERADRSAVAPAGRRRAHHVLVSALPARGVAGFDRGQRFFDGFPATASSRAMSASTL